jgi:nicotinamide riboside kinase
MKIAIIGTHSTGKTTLLTHVQHALVSRGEQVEVLPELARVCPFPINEETSLEAQAWIQTNQIQQEQHLHTPGAVLLCDRSTLDNFAYMQRAAMLAGQDVAAIEAAAAEHMKTYDYIFKTTMLQVSATEDGVRTTDETFRNDINARIEALLSTYAVEYHELESTTDYDVHVTRIIDTLTVI